MLLTICFYYKCCYCFVVFYNIVNLLHFYIFFFIIKQKNCKLCTNIYLFLFYSSLFQFLSFPYCNVLCLDTRDIFLRFYFVLVIHTFCFIICLFILFFLFSCLFLSTTIKIINNNICCGTRFMQNPICLCHQKVPFSPF